METTGEVALGAVAAVGEATLFFADLATFGAISSLTGSDNESWAASPDTSASLYSEAASAYVSVKSTAPSRTYSGGSGSASYGSAAALGVEKSAQSDSSTGAGPRQRYPASELRHCVSLINDGNTLASFIQNSCSEKIIVAFVPTSGVGAGRPGADSIAPGARQSINKTMGLSGVLVCRYVDSMDTKSGYCNVFTH